MYSSAHWRGHYINLAPTRRHFFFRDQGWSWEIKPPVLTSAQRDLLPEIEASPEGTEALLLQGHFFQKKVAELSTAFIDTK